MFGLFIVDNDGTISQMCLSALWPSEAKLQTDL